MSSFGTNTSGKPEVKELNLKVNNSEEKNLLRYRINQEKTEIISTQPLRDKQITVNRLKQNYLSETVNPEYDSLGDFIMNSANLNFLDSYEKKSLIQAILENKNYEDMVSYKGDSAKNVNARLNKIFQKVVDHFKDQYDLNSLKQKELVKKDMCFLIIAKEFFESKGPSTENQFNNFIKQELTQAFSYMTNKQEQENRISILLDRISTQKKNKVIALKHETTVTSVDRILNEFSSYLGIASSNNQSTNRKVYLKLINNFLDPNFKVKTGSSKILSSHNNAEALLDKHLQKNSVNFSEVDLVLKYLLIENIDLEKIAKAVQKERSTIKRELINVYSKYNIEQPPYNRKLFQEALKQKIIRNFINEQELNDKKILKDTLLDIYHLDQNLFWNNPETQAWTEENLNTLSKIDKTIKNNIKIPDKIKQLHKKQYGYKNGSLLLSRILGEFQKHLVENLLFTLEEKELRLN